MPALLTLIALLIWLMVAPPRWWLNLTKPVDLRDAPRAGAQIVERYGCRSCHMIAGRGALKAPDLAGVSQRLDRVALRLWLMNPRAIDARTAMPNFHLSDAEIDALVAYLRQLDIKIP